MPLCHFTVPVHLFLQPHCSKSSHGLCVCGWWLNLWPLAPLLCSRFGISHADLTFLSTPFLSFLSSFVFLGLSFALGGSGYMEISRCSVPPATSSQRHKPISQSSVIQALELQCPATFGHCPSICSRGHLIKGFCLDPVARGVVPTPWGNPLAIRQTLTVRVW